MKQPSPIKSSQRIHALDSLRGFALLGVAAVNLLYISGPGGITTPPAADIADRTGFFLTHWLFAGKSYSLFALLFGISFGLQVTRIEKSRADTDLFFVRRFGVLALFGILHAFLLWQGDILLVYAAFGIILTAVRNWSPKLLTGVGLTLLLLPVIVNIVLALNQLPAAPVRAPNVVISDDSAIFRSGTFATILEARATDALRLISGQITVSLPNILSMMLFGLTAVKSGRLKLWLSDEQELIRCTVIGLGLGVPANAFYAWVYMSVAAPHPLYNAAAAVHTIAAPLMMLGTAAALVWLGNGVARGVVAALAPVGRMALTNYVLQSVVFNVLFFSYGLRLYGRTNDLLNLLIAVTLFSAQIIISRRYAQRFERGPLEALWRRLTYPH